MAQINMRIDEQLKKDAEMVFDSIGLTTSTAFTLFLKAVVRENRIPFSLTADPFYSKENMDELRRRIKKRNFVHHDVVEE